MYFKQFYLGCLAHASYVLGAEGSAVVIDPQRDVDQYIEAARDAGLDIRYVIETHVHADFVSGHRELARRTGAEIVLGWRAAAPFPHRAVHDGDELTLGPVTLRILETPGHTPESISILATDSERADASALLFTGDTLFIGDVGRPDLVGSKGYSAAEMASLLYDSLHAKLLKLDDAVEVYPAHGAGSLCGKNISSKSSSTIGDERAANYALQPMSKEAFIALMTTGLPEVPQYFGTNASLNLGDVQELSALQRPLPLSPQAVAEHIERGDLVLDVRPSEDFMRSHVSGSLNIGLDGQFASWAGTLVPFDRPIVLVADRADAIDEAVMRLARVGFSSVVGYLDGSMPAWSAAGLPTSCTPQITADALHRRLERGDAFQLVDVRRPAEFAAGAAPGAISVPLAQIEHDIARLDPEMPTVVMCAGGYRSCIAASLLEAHHFCAVENVVGGMTAYTQADCPIVESAPA